MDIKVLYIGDVVGRPGRQVLAEELTRVVREHEIDCVIANVENVAGGSGLTIVSYDKLCKYGINLMTLGDHVYRKREIIDTLCNSDCIVRPANLPSKAAGKEWAVYTTRRGPQIAVVTLLGRMYMSMPSDNPFSAIDRVLKRIPSDVRIVFVEMHAEATSEKIAMGWYLDGQVSAVIGTHTHVVTADETVLPKGTGYITDIGMTGPHESVLGRTVDRVVKSLVTQMPYMYSVATGDIRMNGVIVTVESNTGRARDIERICVKLENPQQVPYDNADGRPDKYSNGAP
ncbi:MAG: TIGR00282 family metallophosphoesterase [Sedimentisphaerales bacterium]|nr:TIGR00282 family metallophosphoesterase [Sedimentisphaerales bacterium]